MPPNFIAPKPQQYLNSSTLSLEGSPHNEQSLPKLIMHPITLKFEDLEYKVKVNQKEKTILNGITGVVCPGEILAMLGPSGSGKTTLLTALGGRLAGKLSGKVTYNNQTFSGLIKRRTGFVAQDDVLYPHLSVTETLVFTALLRLPQTLTRDEKVEHVERVITELGLSNCRNSMIGGPLLRGISGGEKRRVSIGQEMLINPSLLLLDEPTSGLDSTTALRILNTIKKLASGGCPIYYGPASTALDYFSSLGFSTCVTVNPADLLLDLANGIGPESKHVTEQSEALEIERKNVRETLISAYDRNLASKLKAEISSMEENNFDACTKIQIKPEQWCTSWWYQFTVLLQRGVKERRHEAFNKLRIFQVVSVAFLAGLLWWHTPKSHLTDRIALLFFFAVFWGFYPLYNAVFTFPQERRMLIKERSSGMYRLSSYFLARTIGDLPLELALPTAFVIILYWMGGLKPDFMTFILSLLVVLYSVVVSQSLGLAFGAILMDIKQATTLASVTTLVFLIAGGYYIQQIPPFIVWLKYLSYSYYCYKLLLGVQYGENDYYQCSNGEMCKVLDFPPIKSMGLNHMWVDVSVMALMLVGYRLVAYFALHRVR
ncbi:unnamed protein product [Vicia faba]|uniref:ABC transporter domain-containing protein n=1 Tax=Vicia faba TaxID=3906 RepID=A0AAV0YSI4_VICFA|nr:unnamed protein product [Vicia faba]